jgi:hypothetical protein
MNKLERIMAKIQEICGLRCGQYCGGPNCPVFEDIAAIHAAPDTIEVEGVEWKRTKQVWETRPINGVVGGVQEINGKFEFWVMDWKDYPRREDMENGCDLATALAAATAAIKGEKR